MYSLSQVQEYVTPAKFAGWEEMGKTMGFLYTASGPLVRNDHNSLIIAIFVPGRLIQKIISIDVVQWIILDTAACS